MMAIFYDVSTTFFMTEDVRTHQNQHYEVKCTQ